MTNHNDGQLNVSHHLSRRLNGPVSRRVSVARRQRWDSGPWRIDLQVSCRLSCRFLDQPRRTHELQTFRTQDLSFPRTKGPYEELSFPRNESSRNFRSRDLWFPGTFVLGERKFPATFIPGPFRSRELSFPENESSWELSFPGPFVPRNFRSQDFSFIRLFYKALTMNAESYGNCQNLFRSRPSSVCFQKIN